MLSVQDVAMHCNQEIVDWDAPIAETLRGEKSLLIMEKNNKRGIQMKIKVLKKTANELKIEVEGEGHSLLNLLQKSLLEDKKIEMAGYDVPHPLIDRAILYVQTKEKQNPEDVINEATKKVLGLSKDFQKSFKKASKSYKPK